MQQIKWKVKQLSINDLFKSFSGFIDTKYIFDNNMYLFKIEILEHYFLLNMFFMFHKELVILDKILNLNHIVRWWLVGGGQKNLTQTHR